MRAYGYACFGGVEIGNVDRTASYLSNGYGFGGYETGVDCGCAVLDQSQYGGYFSPVIDPAPWYDPDIPASEEFLGLAPERIDVLPVLERPVTRKPSGAIIGSMRPKPRTVDVTGRMYAASHRGMAYGWQWLNEVLAGTICLDGREDELVYLPSCPPDDDPDPEATFRRLLQVGIGDFPAPVPVGNFPECEMLDVRFQLMASNPFKYTQGDRCLDDWDIGAAGLNCSLTTPEWTQTGTFRMEFHNPNTTDVTNIAIEGKISLDGDCPIDGLGTSVSASWSYVIPLLQPGERVLIDGPRRMVEFYDPSCKQWTQDLSKVTFEGVFPWPDVGPCTTMCVSISGAPTAHAIVDTVMVEK